MDIYLLSIFQKLGDFIFGVFIDDFYFA